MAKQSGRSPLAAVYIVRDKSTDQGTPGVMVLGADGRGKPWTCFTLELPWRDNRPDLSCIPVGRYRCNWYFSPHFHLWMYGVLRVPGRSGIAIHSGNLAGDEKEGLITHSRGCILLARHRGMLMGQTAILVSRPTVGQFQEKMKRKPFDLIVMEGG